MSEIQTPGQSLIGTLKNSELTNLTLDVAEVGLDHILDAGFLQQLPAFGVVQKGLKAVGAVSDYYLLKKLWAFLSEFNDVPSETRKKQIAKLLVDERYQNQVGENLFLLLDKMTHFAKPKMLARAFRAYLEEKFDLPTYLAIQNAIADLYPGYLGILREFYEDENRQGDDRWQALFHLGFCGLVTVRHSKWGKGYIHNEVGEIFVKEILPYCVSTDLPPPPP
ncbi:hypothetical protein JYT15_00450 [Acidimicrobium ferrooxidans]|nr:hypothetical protein [Acidimicrobium ferrooxidans]